MDITLTSDQQAAYRAIVGFLTNPNAKTFVLKGYAGTGKSTLVNKFLSELSSILRTVQLITQSKQEWDVHLTATTNKAVEALSNIVDAPVKTIQSFLGLRVITDYKNRTSSLEAKDGVDIKENCIIIIDEASYIDEALLDWIDQLTENCKIIFIGDPAQLTPVKTNYAPAFARGYPEAHLEEVVRQAKGNPIIDLATAFRNTVNTGEFFSFTPDGYHIQHLPREAFNTVALEEFSRPDWTHNCSKVLAWTNKRVIEYNHAIRNNVQGVPELQVGDYAVCNQYTNFTHHGRRCKLATDQTVRITNIHEATELGIKGWLIVMDNYHTAFMPASLEDKKNLLQTLRKAGEWDKVKIVEERWVDLRAAYACTINKSQGSTYDKVFIDIDDVSKCNSGNTIARMMYVAVSRARSHVYMTGDFI